MNIFKLLVAALWLGVVAFVADAGAKSIPWRLPKYSLTARAMNVRQAFDTFGVAEGVPVVASKAVQGEFSGTFTDVPADEFLDRLATIHNLAWYYDGAALYVYAASEVRTMMQDLRYMKAGEVCALLKELGVEDERYPIKAASNDELILVSGPPRYVELLAEMIARADKLREMRTFAEVETRVFPIVHTWADNVSISASAAESTVSIKGVATLLKEIMNTQLGGNLRASSNEVAQVEQQREPGVDQFQPVIIPENRLNAVIVRDVATKMPQYEQIIRELDKPQKLVEIGVTALEMSKNDSLDWQLSLKVTGTHRDMAGGVGQNAQNLTEIADLAGEGLAGAFTYLGKDVNVGASISAMKAKGKARNVSRTSLLTMNNMAANMSDSQSYHAKVVGENVADIKEVSAGMSLQVKPRVVDPPVDSTNLPAQVWLTMRLDDGGFGTISVDGMPMTRKSSLVTQAALADGDSLLLAGYFRDIDEDGGWGIPFLRDIPWIGWIFGGYSKNMETVQRLFVLTPHVIDAAYYNCTSQDVVSVQMLRQRDIAHEQELADQADRDDAARTEREERLEEKTAVRHEEDKESLKRFRKERDFRSEQRHDAQKAERKVWEEDFKARKEAYEESRK